jgi:sulfite reductase (ferredoxin)
MAKPDAERVKEESRFLRGTLREELAGDSTHLSDDAKLLVKFHGTYEQDDRDLRKERAKAGLGPAYSFMVRTVVPGGVLSAKQYLELDRLADAYANGSLRITTRQGIQLHGVLKGDLKATIREMNEALVTTLAACGDVVRNITACPSPRDDRRSAVLIGTSRELAAHLLPRSGAYHEIWLDGEPVAAPDAEEPIYGPTYLPRKFKIGLATPDDNCVDVYTQDVGLILLDEPEGFNVLVGGGMGRTTGKEDTFPRLADPLVFVPLADVVPVVEEIVRIQRDHGNREDRKHARMKYLVESWGVARFRAELERRLGRPLADPRPLPPLQVDYHVGAGRQPDGRAFLGVFVENGRIRDAPELRLRSALRRIVQAYAPGVRLTPTQNVILADLRPADVPAIEAILREAGYPGRGALSNARLHAMACPALPTCPLAVAESERELPGVISEIEKELAAMGLAEERLTIRMTGCPNGCARPYVADVGFVGRAPGKYALFLGGNVAGTRLNQVFADLVDRRDVTATLRPLFARFRDERREGEAFGDYCARVGVAALRGP